MQQLLMHHLQIWMPEVAQLKVQLPNDGHLNPYQMFCA